MREAAPGTPEVLAQIVEKALAKNPDGRFPERKRDAGRAAPGPGPQRGPGPRRGAGRRSRACPRRRFPAAGGSKGGQRSRGAFLPLERAPDLAGWLPTDPAGRPGAGPSRGGRRGVGAAELRSRPADPVPRPGGRGRQPRPQGDRLAGRARTPPTRRGQLRGRRAGGGAGPEARPAERRGPTGPGGGRRRAESDRRRGRGGPRGRGRRRPRGSGPGRLSIS